MSEVQAGKPGPDLLKWAIRGVAIIGVAAVLYVIVASSFKPKEQASLSDLARGGLEKLEITSGAAPAIPFTGPDGKPVTIADFKGQVVVMNLWATWCAPCVKEMPTLAKLQATYAAAPVAVVPVSVDRESDEDLARSFMARHAPLKFYRDPGYKVAFGLEPRAKGFPTTVVYDRQGRERARLAGEADWASAEARQLVERLLAEK